MVICPKGCELFFREYAVYMLTLRNWLTGFIEICYTECAGCVGLLNILQKMHGHFFFFFFSELEGIAWVITVACKPCPLKRTKGTRKLVSVAKANSIL